MIQSNSHSIFTVTPVLLLRQHSGTGGKSESSSGLGSLEGREEPDLQQGNGAGGSSVCPRVSRKAGGSECTQQSSFVDVPCSCVHISQLFKQPDQMPAFPFPLHQGLSPLGL